MNGTSRARGALLIEDDHARMPLTIGRGRQHPCRAGLGASVRTEDDPPLGADPPSVGHRVLTCRSNYGSPTLYTGHYRHLNCRSRSRTVRAVAGVLLYDNSIEAAGLDKSVPA